MVLPRSFMRHLTPKLPEQQRSLHHTSTQIKAMQRLTTSTQGKHTCLLQQSWCPGPDAPRRSSPTPALIAGKSDEHAGHDISRLAPHLQQEWDHKANAHLGSITIAPQSTRKVW